MTTPTPPPDQPPPQPPPSAAEISAARAEAAALTEDTSSLVPTLTTILAAYIAYRATKGVIKGRWESIADAMKLEAMAGAAVGNVALRALTRQRRRLGRDAQVAKDDLARLAETEPEAVRRATRAAHRMIAETLRDWSVRYETPDKTDTELYTSDKKPDPQIVRELAEHVAHTTSNAAVAAAAEVTPGWRKSWHSRNDNRVRISHAFLGAKGYDSHIVAAADPFRTPSGSKLMYPGDPAAPLAEVINCRCWMTLYPAVNAAGQAATTKVFAPGAEQDYAKWRKANEKYKRDLAAYRKAIAAWEADKPVSAKNKPAGPPQQPKPFAHKQVSLAAVG